MYNNLLNPSTVASVNTSDGSSLCWIELTPTKPMPMDEGATASPWWWSLLDVRCGLCSLVVLFLHIKPGWWSFFSAGMDLGVKWMRTTAADERQQRVMKACQWTKVTVGCWGAMAGWWRRSREDSSEGASTEYGAVVREGVLLYEPVLSGELGYNWTSFPVVGN